MGKVTRKQHMPEFKAKVALEAMRGEQTNVLWHATGAHGEAGP